MSSTNKPSVLMVCLGNYCRSPLAYALFLNYITTAGLKDQFGKIDSAGTSSYHVGDRPDPRTISTCRKHNVPISCIGRQLNKSDFDQFDYVFGMDDSNVSNIKRVQPKGSKAQVRLWGSVDDGKIIVDPWYDDGSDGFERCYEQCLRYSKAFIKELGMEPKDSSL